MLPHSITARTPGQSDRQRVHGAVQRAQLGVAQHMRRGHARGLAVDHGQAAGEVLLEGADHATDASFGALGDCTRAGAGVLGDRLGLAMRVLDRLAGVTLGLQHTGDRRFGRIAGRAGRGVRFHDVLDPGRAGAGKRGRRAGHEYVGRIQPASLTCLNGLRRIMPRPRQRPDSRLRRPCGCERTASQLRGGGPVSGARRRAPRQLGVKACAGMLRDPQAASGTRKSRLMPAPRSPTRARNCVR